MIELDSDPLWILEKHLSREEFIIVTIVYKPLRDWGRILYWSWCWLRFFYFDFFFLNLCPVVDVQLLSCVWLFEMLWTTGHQTSLFFTISWSLQKLTSIESMMPSNHLILCHPLFLLPSIFSSIRVFSSDLVLCIRWPNCWSFNFSYSPSNEYSGLISFRTDWFDLLAIQGTLKCLLQHHNSKISILWHSAFFMGFPDSSVGKESTCNVGDLGLIFGLGKSPGEGKDYPLQYPGLENSMDCIVHGVTESWRRLSDFHFYSHPLSGYCHVVAPTQLDFGKELLSFVENRVLNCLSESSMSLKNIFSNK